MRYKAVFYLLGHLILIIGVFLLIPVGVSFLYGEAESVRYFLLSAVLIGFLGLSLLLRFRHYKDEALGLRDGFLLVTLAWFLVSFFGALPFYFSGFFSSFMDAFFESVSGFTTTGASVLTNVERLPYGLLFWRNFTQWIGGMGIIVLAIAVLPQLSIGGMQLMKNEMPGPTFEQLKPRIKQTALSLWKIYMLFSAAQIFLLHIFGMSLFDSVCHMCGTMATGGFSTQNASIGAYGSPAIQMTVTAFMFLAGMNFVLHYAWLQGKLKRVFYDSEWRFYVGLVFFAFLAVAASLFLQRHFSFWTSLRLSIFQVLSIITTTGFVTDDFGAWPHLAMGVLFLLMFVGGCAGSTGGGIKIVRWELLLEKAKQSIVQHIFPKAVISVKLNKKVVPESILYGVSSFFIIYVLIFFFCSLILFAFNIDFFTAASAVIACLGNIGPGFGKVGASLNYAYLPAFIKMVLSACMIIGRLEIFTVLVLFYPAAWRR